MELASLFLLVLLPPADATGATATAVAASLRRELGDVAMAIAPDTLVTPAMWQGEQARMHARFVVHLVWTDDDRASVEVVSTVSTPAEPGIRRVRELAFAPQDSKTERGRTIGLVIAEILRESPASALVASQLGVNRASPQAARPSHVALGGMFVAERVRADSWAVGPELTCNFGFSEAVRLQISGAALFGPTNQYIDIGVGAGIWWDFLRAERGRNALGVGLGVDLLHESATPASDADEGASQWNLALGAGLGGRLTVWRKLRIIGDLGLRATPGKSLTVGDENPSQRYSLSRWRPVFAVGLELAL